MFALAGSGGCSVQGDKIVVAHFMVGNTYPYTARDWLDDICLASAHGLDGFALNVGCEAWQKSRVADCYDAALQSGLPFKLFLSFDMTSIPAQDARDVALLCEYYAAVAAHPNQLRRDGKPVVTTFAGENSRFGQQDLNHAWAYVKLALEKAIPAGRGQTCTLSGHSANEMHFVPSFFVDPGSYPNLTAVDGCFNWNGSWPTHLAPNSPRSEIRSSKLESDQSHINHLGGRTFMAAVSPWFFTHYGPDSWNKNWIYRSDDWLFARRWEQLVAMRSEIDIVQVVSWNDYGESHYIGPVRGAQPNSQRWVDGFPHEAWLHLNSYYACAFKAGAYPAVEEDRVYMWARPHLKGAHAPDAVPRPDNWELTGDVFWVVVFAKAPATVLLTNSDAEDEGAQVFDVSAGVAKLSHPMRAGASMRAQIVRAGVCVAECAPEREGFRFQEHPEVYNFNAYVAMSS